MMNMAEFVAAGGADCAAAYWRYQQRVLEEVAIVSPKIQAEAVEEPKQEWTADIDVESGWDI